MVWFIQTALCLRLGAHVLGQGLATPEWKAAPFPHSRPAPDSAPAPESTVLRENQVKFSIAFWGVGGEGCARGHMYFT